MRSGNLWGAGRLWLIGLAAAIVWVVPATLGGQSPSLPEQGPLSASQPFAGLDHSLTEAAEALLTSADQTTTAKDYTKPTSSLAVDADRQSLSLGDGIKSNAAARLYLLRPAIEPILRSYGVPADLAAVVLVESGGRGTALSAKGARGLWQLMPDTARRFGLRVDDTRDDRLDVFKATDAAARYLHELYAQFGDWKLALAAYNAGEATVSSAILRAHSLDFDQLTSLRMLPLETRNYVPRVLAAVHSTGQLSTLGSYHSAASAITVFAVSSR